MGNYLMAFGALVIFSIFSLLTNKTLINNKKVAMESQFIITATGLGQSIIEEAKNKAFDEKTTSDTVTVVSSLSTTLGPDPGEAGLVPLPDYLQNNTFKSTSVLNYDDIDDYNGYRRIVDTRLNGNDTINVQVAYVDSTGASSAGKSFYKKMTVKVTSAFISIPGGIELNYIFSYYK